MEDAERPTVEVLATEKLLLRRNLRSGERLNTEARRLGEATYPNPVREEQIGRYRPWDSRMCVTAEMELIEGYLDKKEPLPAFFEAGPRAHLYFQPHDVRIGIVTPGGIAPGLNTVIHSIVNMHSRIYGMRKDAYGFRGGFQGILEQRVERLAWQRTKEWLHLGGVEIAAGRAPKDQTVIERIVRSLDALGVDILYVIGGDGSLRAAHLIAQEIHRRGQTIAVAGIPKTMDNDVLWVWHSFGFDTAVDEATRVVNALHAEAKSTERVCLVPLFGREAGFVAAHAALASGCVDAVLVPEVSFKLSAVIKYVKEVVQEQGYALLVVAEGACPEEYSEENLMAELQQQGLDPTDRTNPRVAEALRSARLSVLQRSLEEFFHKFRGGRHRVFVNEPRYLIRAVPANSVDQIYCQRLADLAVHSALAGFTDFVISQWLTEYVLVPLELVATGHKSIPPGGIFWTTVINSTGQPSFDC